MLVSLRKIKPSDELKVPFETVLHLLDGVLEGQKASLIGLLVRPETLNKDIIKEVSQADAKILGDVKLAFMAAAGAQKRIARVIEVHQSVVTKLKHFKYPHFAFLSEVIAKYRARPKSREPIISLLV